MACERWRRSAVAVMILIAVLLPGGGGSTAPDCSPPSDAANGAARSPSAVVDPRRAELSRRRHLEVLFSRYGENGTMSLVGLKRLLVNVGLDRIRTVLVRHHEQPGRHPHENHLHHHRHDDGGDSHRQERAGVSKQATVPKNPEDSRDQDSRRGVAAAAAAAREGDPTPLYSVWPTAKPESSPGSSRTSPAPPTQTEETATGAERRDGDGRANDTDREECLSASAVLSSHGMSQAADVSVSDFSVLCPALLQQVDDAACILHSERDHEHDAGLHGNHSSGAAENGKSVAIAWAGGFVSVTAIALLATLGVVLIPLMNAVFFKFLLSFLVALAVGALSGDAFLHLIPHSQGGHAHDHDDPATASSGGHHAHGEPEGRLDAVWKGLTALGGVYVMFLIEHFLTLGKMYKDRKQKVQKKWDRADGADPERQPALEEKPNEGRTRPPPPPERRRYQTAPSSGRLHVETNGAGMFGHRGGGAAEEDEEEEEQQVMLSVVSPSGGAAAAVYTAQDCENKCHSHFHDTVGQADSMHHHHHDYHHILHHHHSQNHHPHSHAHSYSQQHFQQAGVAALAWMVVMGDGLHNFSHGLAIGAAFSDGLSSGLSTSVAVFCHELPHELGDFAVRLKSGMTVRQAILCNALSATMAYVGAATGVLIGLYAEDVRMWVFALTAGLFMYVALVDMVPEMLHNDAGDHGFSHCGFFLLQNAGILLGFAAVLLIALFEHKIQLDFGG
ncbi:zinc transporter ZIP6 [Brachionichthys hirsutus]|uniref:zinc transporter ZIP6 n=1 Tax=Brachionichthys hirsutus TaxID=412623 RepID=UPI0036053D25